VAEPKDLRAR